MTGIKGVLSSILLHHFTQLATAFTCTSPFPSSSSHTFRPSSIYVHSSSAMKLITATLFSLLVSSAVAAPQLEVVTGLVQSALDRLPGILTSSKPLFSPDKRPNALGCTQFFTGVKAGEFSADPAGGSYSICFESVPGTCGIKFDLSKLVTSADQPVLLPQASEETPVQETLVPETLVKENPNVLMVPMIPTGTPGVQRPVLISRPQTPLLVKDAHSVPTEASQVPQLPVQEPQEPKSALDETQLISKPRADLCENSLFFPPTSSSFGGKVICLDRVTEPSVLLIGTPHVVYANTRKGSQFTIPFAYLTSC